MRGWIKDNGFSNTQGLIDYAYAVATKYGEASGALAAAMYDAIVDLEKAFYPPAEPAATPSYGEVAKTVNGVLKYSQNPNSLANSVGRLVKRTGADTMLQNAERDGAQFAWVPHGDTCAFCITLASRGWQKVSAKSFKNGHAEHIHTNCDCTYAVRHDSSFNVEGYDPEHYLEMYQNAEGSTPTEKVNALRRAQYEQNKDKIRAQKREEYRIRTQLEGLQGLTARDNILRGAASNKFGEPVYFDENADYSISVPEYNEEVNAQLSASARKVAEYGSRDSYEYAAIVDLDTAEEVDFGTSQNYMNVSSYYPFLREHPSGRYAMVHNHNIVSDLSLEDVQELTMWKNLDSVTAVQNNGAMHGIVSNGVKSNQPLSLEFDFAGKEFKVLEERENAKVKAAIAKYTKREIRSGNSAKR